MIFTADTCSYSSRAGRITRALFAYASCTARLLWPSASWANLCGYRQAFARCAQECRYECKLTPTISARRHLRRNSAERSLGELCLMVGNKLPEAEAILEERAVFCRSLDDKAR